MHVILGQRVGERGGRGICLLGLMRIDHRHEQAGELRERLIELGGLLPPGQAAGEHAVGVGANAEVCDRVPGGEGGQQQAAQRHEECVAAAEFGQSDDEAVQNHPGSQQCGGPAVAGAV